MSAEHGPSTFLATLVGYENETLASALVILAVLCIFGLIAQRKLRSASNPLIPDENLTARNTTELLAEFILRLGDSVLGKENRRYLPFLGTIFVYILVSNLMGLIPGFSTPTSKLTFNFGMGFTVFFLYNYWGIKEQGLYNYIKHFWGPLWVPNPLWLLGLVVFLIEVISHFIRPVSLSVRLFANMTADHGVLHAFTKLSEAFYIPIPVIFYLMGTFVCIMQAFIFTLLSMIYIRLAVAHEEHGDADHGESGHAAADHAH